MSKKTCQVKKWLRKLEEEARLELIAVDEEILQQAETRSAVRCPANFKEVREVR